MVKNWKRLKNLMATCLRSDQYSHFTRHSLMNFFSLADPHSSENRRRFAKISSDQWTNWSLVVHGLSDRQRWRRKRHEKQKRIKNVNGHCFGFAWTRATGTGLPLRRFRKISTVIGRNSEWFRSKCKVSRGCGGE